MTSIEATKEIQSQNISAAPASTASANEPMHAMETKCTQTKLDEDDPPPPVAPSSGGGSEPIEPTAIEPSASDGPQPKQPKQPCPALPASNEPEPAEVEGVSKSEAETKAAEPEIAGTEAGGTSGQAADTTAESKGEMATWTSSTEVCPWEDE